MSKVTSPTYVFLEVRQEALMACEDFLGGLGLGRFIDGRDRPAVGRICLRLVGQLRGQKINFIKTLELLSG